MQQINYGDGRGPSFWGFWGSRTKYGEGQRDCPWKTGWEHQEEKNAQHQDRRATTNNQQQKPWAYGASRTVGEP